LRILFWIVLFHSLDFLVPDGEYHEKLPHGFFSVIEYLAALREKIIIIIKPNNNL